MSPTQKERLIETLERISKRANTLIKCIDDIDEKSITDIDISLSMLDKSVGYVLKNQKDRGKEFLSDAAIDKIVDEAIKDANESK